MSEQRIDDVSWRSQASFKEKGRSSSRFPGRNLRTVPVLLNVIIFFAFGCSEKREVFRLERGTKSYLLAKELAEVVPVLDPDKTVFLIKSRKFVVTASEAVHELRLSSSANYDKLKDLTPENLKGLIEHSAWKLAEKKLWLAEAERSALSVGESEVADFLDEQYEQAGGEEKFLKMISNNGLEIEYVKQDIRKTLLVKKYIEEKVYADIQIKEEDILNLYQKDKTVTMRHILLGTPGMDEAGKKEVYRRMDEILARAREGEDFSELAARYSEDLESKDKGGLYENIGPETLMRPLEQAAFSVPVGEISGIIETPMGYHIIKVIERRKEHRPLEEVRRQLEAVVRHTKQAKAYRSHLIELGAKYDVIIAQL